MNVNLSSSSSVNVLSANHKMIFKYAIVYLGSGMHILYIALDYLLDAMNPTSITLRLICILTAIGCLPFINGKKYDDSYFYAGLLVYATNTICMYNFCAVNPMYFSGLATCATFIAILPYSKLDFSLLSIITLYSFFSPTITKYMYDDMVYHFGGLVFPTFVIYIISTHYRESIIKQRSRAIAQKNIANNLREDLKNKNSSLLQTQQQLIHDVKAPLMALKMIAEKSSNQDHRHLLSQTTERVENMIFDLQNPIEKELTFEPLALGPQSHESPKRLSLQTQQVIDEFKYQLPENGSVKLTTNLEISKNEPITLSSQYSRVLSNLLKNALEARNKKNHEIQLSVFKTDKLLNIQVKDNGKGVERSLCQRLFHRGFSYGKPHGTGIGLSHAKEWVDNLGGKIQFFSKPNTGSMIHIQIPEPTVPSTQFS